MWRVLLYWDQRNPVAVGAGNRFKFGFGDIRTHAESVVEGHEQNVDVARSRPEEERTVRGRFRGEQGQKLVLW